MLIRPESDDAAAGLILLFSPTANAAGCRKLGCRLPRAAGWGFQSTDECSQNTKEKNCKYIGQKKSPLNIVSSEQLANRRWEIATPGEIRKNEEA
jgi:hypothetical protein